MGKKDNRVAFINPIAAGRSSGAANSGPSIKDYLNRPRPSWDEMKEMIRSRRKGSRTLEEFESKLNKDYRAQLERGRAQFFASDKKKRRKRRRSRSSPSPSSSTSTDNRTRKHRGDDYSSDHPTTESEWEEHDESVHGRTKKRKKKKKKKKEKC